MMEHAATAVETGSDDNFAMFVECNRTWEKIAVIEETVRDAHTDDHLDYRWFIIFRSKDRGLPAPHYKRWFFEHGLSFNQTRHGLTNADGAFPSKVIWPIEELRLIIDSVQNSDSDWSLSIRSDLVKCVYIVNRKAILANKGIIVRPGMSGVYYISHVLCGEVVHSLDELAHGLGSEFFPVSTTIAEIESLTAKDIKHWRQDPFCIGNAYQNLAHDDLLLRCCIANSFKDAMHKSVGVIGGRVGNNSISFTIQWNARAVINIFTDPSVSDVGWIKNSSLTGPTTSFCDGGGFSSFDSTTLCICKRFADPDMLSGLFGTFWYCNPVLRTAVERLGKDGDGSLSGHIFTMISRNPGHFVEFSYDLHHNSLLVKAHVTHLVPYLVARYIPDEIARDLSQLRVSLLGQWTMFNCADEKLNGQSIVIYLVERNSVEFNDEKGHPVIFTVAWGYAAKNLVQINAGKGVFECSMKLDHVFRDFNGWWFNALSDFIHPSREVDGSRLYATAVKTKSKKRTSQMSRQELFDASTDDDASVVSDPGERTSVRRRRSDNPTLIPDYLLKMRERIDRWTSLLAWKLKKAPATTWVHTLTRFDDFLSHGTPTDLDEAGIGRRLLGFFDYPQWSKHYSREAMIVCIELCFDLRLDLALMPMPWTAFLGELGIQIINHAKVMLFLDPADPKAKGDDWFGSVDDTLLKLIFVA